MSADNYFITDQNAVYFLTFTVAGLYHENSLKALIVAEPHEYLFSWVRDYAGQTG